MNTVFTASKIWSLYDRNLGLAERKLRSLPIYGGGEPKFRGLSGWVFEQVILHCLRKELQAAGVKCSISEQATIGGRAKADLKLDNHVLVELKLSGSYGVASYTKYPKYRKTAEKAGYTYLWFSGEESYRPYRVAATSAFGRSNTFYLDSTADWRRFLQRVRSLLKSS